MRKGESLSEEQKVKMAEGRARSKHNADAAEDRMVERIAARVLAALDSKVSGLSSPPPEAELMETVEFPEAKPVRVRAPDYERPAAAVRALPPSPEPEPSAINPQVERTVALLETINPSIYDRTSASALLSALRKLGDRIGQYLQTTAPGPAELRCRICGAPVNPERPAAIRTVRNPETGLEENAFFHSSACALMWDSGRRTMTETGNGGKGPLVALD